MLCGDPLPISTACHLRVASDHFRRFFLKIQLFFWLRGIRENLDLAVRVMTMVGKEKAMVTHIKWVNVAYMISVSLVGFSSPTVQAKDLEKLRALKAKVIPSKGIKEFEEKRLKALEEMQQDHDETEAMLRNIGKALRTDADKREKVKDKKTAAEQARDAAQP